MRAKRLGLFQIVAIMVVIALAVFSPLISLPGEKAVGQDMTVPPQIVRVATFDRPRPEVRIERVLRLDEFKGFDPDLASLWKAPRGRPLTDDHRLSEKAGARQVASLSPEWRGGRAR